LPGLSQPYQLGSFQIEYRSTRFLTWIMPWRTNSLNALTLGRRAPRFLLPVAQAGARPENVRCTRIPFRAAASMARLI
jgi:hypothetical protein